MIVRSHSPRKCSPREAGPPSTGPWNVRARRATQGNFPLKGAWRTVLLLLALVVLLDAARAQSAPGGTEIVQNPTGSYEAEALRSDPSFGRPSGRKGGDNLRAVPDSTNADRKSPGWALSYSLGSTVLFAPLFGTGLIAGPAVGHFYAGNSGQAWTGIGIRSGAFLTAGAGYALILSATLPAVPEKPGETTDPGDFRQLGEWAEPTGTVLLVAGITVLLGSAAYDIATVRGAVRDYNRNRTVQARVTPAVGPRGEQIGLSLQLQF